MNLKRREKKAFLFACEIVSSYCFFFTLWKPQYFGGFVYKIFRNAANFFLSPSRSLCSLPSEAVRMIHVFAQNGTNAQTQIRLRELFVFSLTDFCITRLLLRVLKIGAYKPRMPEFIDFVGCFSQKHIFILLYLYWREKPHANRYWTKQLYLFACLQVRLRQWENWLEIFLCRIL